MTIQNYAKAIEDRCEKNEETGCWIWQKATHTLGYAMMRHGNNMKTVQRIMAIELELFPIDKNTRNTRITTTFENKLCCNPDHITSMTYTEMTNRRYERKGTNGRFSGKEQDLLIEYNQMKQNKIPRTINKLGEKYNCHPSLVYRAIYKARKM